MTAGPEPSEVIVAVRYVMGGGERDYDYERFVGDVLVKQGWDYGALLDQRATTEQIVRCLVGLDRYGKGVIAA